MNYWFTSDYHLGHKNVIKYDSRPFSLIEEMNDTIIDNHNSLVKKNDNVYYLGDFCLDRNAEDYLKRLNGKFYFIRGNHDDTMIVKLYQKHGTYLGMMDIININGISITLCHYGCQVWSRSHYGSYHFHSHSHGNLQPIGNIRRMDVGVMLNNYYPFNFDDLKEQMEKIVITKLEKHR